MNKKIIDEIHRRIDGPFKEYMSAVKRFEEQPSIPNGSRKQEAKVGLDNAIKETAEYVFEKWHVSPDEFSKLIDNINYGG